ncbi:MAG: hypothetical protein ACK5KT_16945 [Dysgonomonas sp.]
MNKKIIGDILAIVSTLGITLWLMTDFKGGMIMALMVYGQFILPVILLYIASGLNTIISIVESGFIHNKIKIYSHSLVILFITTLYLYNSEIFKSEKILSARMKDDLFYYTLIFRKDNNCEIDIVGMFGYEDKIKGNYYIKGDTIIFTKVPYDNNFIPDTILIDREQNTIFITRDSFGNFSKKKNSSNYFEIIE